MLHKSEWTILCNISGEIMKIKIFTFGCKVNQAESSGLQQLFSAQGMEQADRVEDADLLIVNSCAVTDESVRKVRQLLRSIQRKNPDALIALTGCWPQAFPDDDFCGADYVTGTKDRDALLQWAVQCMKLRPLASETCITPYRSARDVFSPLPCADTTKTRAFLKIQDGCNQFCSYCIIPFSRGRCRSMPLERLETEVENLAQQGFREIVLTGINLGFYGTDIGCDLADAVEICAAHPKILRVRLGSLEPERITNEMLGRFAACEKFCPQFHLSLQSGSDVILKRMNRRYTAAEYEALAAAIRSLFPDAALTTDVIVGFPSEHEAEYQETVRFVRKIGFAKVHVFPYSKRAGTKAADMEDQIPQTVKIQRSADLTRIANALRRSHLSKYVGRTLCVLVEGKKRQNAQTFFQGHTPDGTLVKIFTENMQKGLRNSVICVTIDSYEDDCCVGRPFVQS